MKQWLLSPLYGTLTCYYTDQCDQQGQLLVVRSDVTAVTSQSSLNEPTRGPPVHIVVIMMSRSLIVVFNFISLYVANVESTTRNVNGSAVKSKLRFLLLFNS